MDKELSFAEAETTEKVSEINQMDEKQQEMQNYKQILEKSNDSIEGRDPVEILKMIFKRKEVKRRPLEANQIANKYRKKFLRDQEKIEKKLKMRQLK